jgi:AraC family transcriptional activator of tynA and feaB
MEWSTSILRREDSPFGSWAEDLAAAFVQLEPRKLGEHPFHGNIKRHETEQVTLSHVEATKHTVLRLRSHIVRSHDDICFINLQLYGFARYTQRGYEQFCGAGDLAVADTTEPFEIANSRDFQLYCFAVPRERLPRYFCERPRLKLSLTDTGRALARTLAGYAELCLGASAPSKISGFGGAHIVDLISHAPEILADTPTERLNVPVLLSMMLDHIDRHSDDPGLCAASLAHRFHCSERYVHKLFAGTGRSAGEYVNDKRVVHCARNLLDRSHRSKTIAEIAFAAGFRDISYFNRLFKRSHGVAPREFRRTMSSELDSGAP